MSKKAILVSSPDEYNHLDSRYRNADYYATNYYSFLKLKDYGVKYLYADPEETSDDYESIIELASTWYRNASGLDIFSKEGISFAPLITRSLISSFANDFRNFNAILPLTRKYTSILVANNAEQSFIRVASVFDKKIELFESDAKPNPIFSSSPTRTVITSFLNREIRSYIARILQAPFLSSIRKKNLVWSDWSYKEIFRKRKDSLYQNSYAPWRGFYITKKNEYISNAEEIFPDSIQNDCLSNESLSKRMKLKNIDWDERLIDLFIDSINRIYSDSYLQLRESYTALVYALKLYSPKCVILPGETSFSHILILQIAKSMDIKRVMSLDGFPVLLEKSLNCYDESGDELLFSTYIGYGSAAKDQYIKRGIPLEKIKVSIPPICNRLAVKKEKAKGKSIGVVIMSYYPNQHNPQTRWDMRYKFVSDIIKLLIELGEGSINLKIKDGLGSRNEAESYEKYFALSGINSSAVNIFHGESSEAIASASYIIGQASSACFESALLEKKYYVYEPKENGITDEMLNSTIADINDVPRTIDELRSALVNRKSLVFKEKNYLTDGESLDQITLV